jgi:competence ComEA-like helix-hairpin-helix protein
MIRMRIAAGALAFALAATALPVTAMAAAQDTKQDMKTVVVTPVNINSATASELEKLPGIGPSMAARIVEYRQKNGAFKKVEDILENHSSCPSLLGFVFDGPCQTVSRNRKNTQQISRVSTGGGRSGGRTPKCVTGLGALPLAGSPRRAWSPSAGPADGPAARGGPRRVGLKGLGMQSVHTAGSKGPSHNSPEDMCQGKARRRGLRPALSGQAAFPD